MTNKLKRKKRLGKAVKQRTRAVKAIKLDRAWINFWNIKTKELEARR
ncbi:Uncharacterised protein [Priestia megaterium]|nr:Uncharacterised protein [Priestia megaterium]